MPPKKEHNVQNDHNNTQAHNPEYVDARGQTRAEVLQSIQDQEAQEEKKYQSKLTWLK